MKRAVLSAVGLSAGYEGRAVVSGVNLECRSGQTLCLIGPNGAGKSTLLRTLAGLLPPVSGQVLLNGVPVKNMDRQRRARALAVVLTERLNPGMMTAYGVAAMGRTPYTGFSGRLSEADHLAAERAMEQVGALELRSRMYMSLSDGERQKVLIARALAQEPRLMVLDEPTSHLDVKHKLEVISILNRLCRERDMAVVLALHDIDLALKACQRLVLVNNGRATSCARPEDMAGPGTIDRLFGIHNASYDDVLGSVELREGLRPVAFVAGGAGTGANVFRALTRAGLGCFAGVLSENDVDFRVARGMGLELVGAPPFAPFGEEPLLRAREMMGRARFLVDTGFPVGPDNADMIALICDMARAGKPLYALRPEADALRLYGGLARALTGPGQLIDILQEGDKL